MKDGEYVIGKCFYLLFQLSISEYRKRKQQSSGGTGAEPESSKDDSTADKNGARGRSDSTSSGTSSLSSDEEGSKASAIDLSGVTTLTLFPNATNENDEKKGNDSNIYPIYIRERTHVNCFYRIT